MKKHRKLKIFGIVVASILAFILVINIVPPAKAVANNPFIVGEGNLPMIAAHRGGGENNPENTMLAFREAVEMGVQILESDLYLTKDGYLVYNHDSYIDRTSNVNGDKTKEEVEELCETSSNRHYISDMTLAELKQYNFGYYFVDEDGNRPYQNASAQEIIDLGLQIATVEMLFEEFYQTNPNLLFIVEIKDGGERGKTACAKLNAVLNEYPAYKNRIVVGTFHDEIESEIKTNYPDLYRGASTGVAAGFIITQIARVNIFYKADFACLQIPTSYDVGITLNLDSKALIDRAHRQNIAVQYWTINDAKEMKRLINLGCDCIMTDNPALLKEVLSEYTPIDRTEDVVAGIVMLVIAVFGVVGAVLSYMEKGFVLNNAYIYASKEERKKMDKKPYYKQSAIVFTLLSVSLVLLGISFLCIRPGLVVLAMIDMAVTVVYAITSTIKILKKREQEIKEEPKNEENKND